MCQYGDTVPVLVYVKDDLSYNGQSRWKVAQIDRCLAPLVSALQRGGIDMLGCCCGHGAGPGSIVLTDGRELVIRKR